MSAVVTLYSRPQCHLCDEARVIVERVCSAKNVVWQEINIETDPALQERYGEYIPVVTVNDEQVSYWRINPDALSAAIDAVSSTHEQATTEKRGLFRMFRRRNPK